MKQFIRKTFLLRKWLGHQIVSLQKNIPLDTVFIDKNYHPLPQTSLYLLHNSLPLHSAGYATRTHGLLKGLHEHKIKASGVTRYGYPEDIGKPGENQGDWIEGIHYHRLPSVNNKGYRQLPLDLYLKAYARSLAHLVQQEKPALLHAASNFLNGLAAITVGRAYRLPVVYEVRGLWELTRLSREPDYKNSRLYKLYVHKETQCCLEADHVLAITEGLRDILVQRGVPRHKITLVQNAVDHLPENLPPPNEALRIKLGLNPQDKVIGYIGSLLDYEGLDDLISALAEIQDLRWKTVIVGDGPERENLETLTRKLHLQNRIIFTGRVPFAEVNAFYSLMDMCPFPRKPLEVCEVVSPIKPFEAMAAQKIVLASNVRALAEIVQDEHTGFLFTKGSVNSLAQKMRQIFSADETHLARIRAQAREWVAKERTWSVQSRKIAQIYEDLWTQR